MGYKMKRGNSAVPFKTLGSSPAKQTDDEKTLKAIDKEEWIGARVDEGSEGSQLQILKKNCAKRGGTWNSSTNSCEGGEKKHFLERDKAGPIATNKPVYEKEDQVIENMSNQEITSEIIAHQKYLQDLKKLSKEHDISAHVTEGTIKSQDLVRKKGKTKKK